MPMNKRAPRGARREWYEVGTEVMAACGQALRRIRATHTDVRSIAVTSTTHGEGRSTIAAGLAAADVRSLGRRCVLLDLDVESWGRGTDKGKRSDPVPGEFELSLLSDTVTLRDLGVQDPDLPPGSLAETVQWATPDLGLLRPAGLVRPEQLSRSFVEALRDDITGTGVDLIVDLPALPPVGTGDEFARLFDVVVLVVRAGGPSQKRIQSAAMTLGEPPVVLLNRSKSAIPSWVSLGGGR